MTQHPTVAEVIAHDLAGYGARRCFGLLGTANYRITHALVAAGVELISARHECNAASMGDAYAKATGELTLVSVHSGPGLTNALTGIAEAAKSRTPLLVLAGDVPTGAVKSNFHIEQAEMVRAVGAVSERIYTPASAREDTLRAVTRALRERQTVVLSLPLDVQDAHFTGTSPADQPDVRAGTSPAGQPDVRAGTSPADQPDVRAGTSPAGQPDVRAGARTPLALPPEPGRLQPAPDAVSRLTDLLSTAKRPLILAGRGAVISGAEVALIALGQRTGALLATSVCGHGLFADDPWSVGICGGFSSPAADELIAGSDVIVGFGVSFTQWTTKKGKLVGPGTKLAQIDIDAGRLGYQITIDHAVHADAKVTAETLLAELDRRGRALGKGARTAATAERLAAGSNHASAYADTSTERFIDPRTLSKAVDALLPAERAVASDSGHFCGWVPRLLRVPDARASCLSHSFQSVGLGLASAIGLGLANPGRLAVLGTGDGGFLMSIADLETVVRLGMRMCILVYNDASYAAEVHYFRRQGLSIDIVQFPETDFAGIARGYGARGVTVRSTADLGPVREWVAVGAPGVMVIDGKINPDLEADWHAEHFPAGGTRKG